MKRATPPILWGRSSTSNEVFVNQCLAGGDQGPDCDEQLACQRDDHRFARAGTVIGSAGLVPPRQCAVLLKPQKSPGELDHAAWAFSPRAGPVGDPGIACFGEPLFPPLR